MKKSKKNKYESEADEQSFAIQAAPDPLPQEEEPAVPPETSLAPLQEADGQLQAAPQPEPVIPPVEVSDIFFPTVTFEPEPVAQVEPAVEAQPSQPALELAPLPEPEMASEISPAAPLSAASLSSAPQPAPEPAAQTAAPAVSALPAGSQLALSRPAPATYSRSQVLGLAASSGFISFLLAVVFILIFLSMVNGGLHYIRPNEFTPLNSQVQQIAGQAALLNTRADEVQKNVQDLSSRVVALEETAKQVKTLQGQVTTLQTDVDSAVSQVETLNGQVQDLNTKVGGLSTQVDGLTKRSDIFQKFLDGLQNLMQILNK